MATKRQTALEFYIEREHRLINQLNDRQFDVFIKAKSKACGLISDTENIYLKDCNLLTNKFDFIIRDNEGIARDLSITLAR